MHYISQKWYLLNISFYIKAVALNFLFNSKYWEKCIMVSTKKYIKQHNCFNTDNNKKYLFSLVYQISILEWFLKVMWHWWLE